MYTKTIEQKVFTYEDLLEDDDLRQKVLDKWVFMPSWVDEWHDSWKGFKKSLPNPPEDPDMTYLRLRTWIINNYLPEIERGKYYSTRGYYDENGKYHYKWRRSNCQKEISCPFTGVGSDMDCLTPILDFIKDPNRCDTWDCLIRQCEDSWEQGFDRDMEWQQSEEYIMESIQANEYEFDEDGNII